MKRTSQLAARVAQALGASRVVRLGPVEHTPIGLVALTERVRCLRSTGPRGTGRPSDPGCTVPRIVKFEPGIWKRLADVAREQARLTGRQVSPAQIASIIVEETLQKAGRSSRRAGHG